MAVHGDSLPAHSARTKIDGSVPPATNGCFPACLCVIRRPVWADCGGTYSEYFDRSSRRRSLSTVLPKSRVPTAMENGQNDDTVCFRAEVHAEWESLGNDTANILVNR